MLLAPPYLTAEDQRRFNDWSKAYGDPVYQYPFWFWPTAPTLSWAVCPPGESAVKAQACAVWGSGPCVVGGGLSCVPPYLEDHTYGSKKPPGRISPTVSPHIDPGLTVTAAPRPVPTETKVDRPSDGSMGYVLTGAALLGLTLLIARR